ncbi:Signal peptidase I [Methanosarcina siciliae C2J]|uniref:Signal peptidase I n=1 Tax=Methanosarcina siciliae C2J TaxID=1434118 RepID=A0A0E3LCL2_9EURY|nr:signal peptidase I [Methanosarcina siciliae]AKB35716.1 Signal peptidase I [Methanosarcina siciliae C2J]
MNTKDILNLILLIILIAPLIGTMIPMDSIHFMTVMGTSMEPVITSDDIIVISSGKTSVELGTIISYYYHFEDNSSPSVITHRVIGFAPEGYRTKGDACANADNYVVAPEDVIGVMRFKIPYLGALIHFANTLMGLFMLVILPAIILIIQEIRYLMRMEEDRDEACK